MITYKSRRRIRRLIKNWTIFSICFVIALSVALVFIFSPKSYARLDGKITLTDIDPNHYLIPFEEGCAYIDSKNGEGEIYYVNNDNELLWGYKGEIDQLKTRASTKRLAVFGSSKLQMLASSGEYLYSKTYDYPIQDLRISNNVCILYQVHGAKDFLTVIDGQGEIIDTIVQQDNEIFLSYGVFSTDETSIWIITANTSGIKPFYRFTTYRYEDTKHITVSYSEYNQIIYAPIFLEKKISLLGSHEVINIDYSGKVLSRTRCVGYENKENNYSNNSNVLLLSSVENSESSKQKVLCILDSGISYFIEENMPIIATAVTKKYIYVFSSAYMYRYDIKSLYKTTYPLPESINSIKVNGYICYLSGNSVHRLILD